MMFFLDKSAFSRVLLFYNPRGGGFEEKIDSMLIDNVCVKICMMMHKIMIFEEMMQGIKKETKPLICLNISELV